MKLITAIILTALLSFISGLFLPWWFIAVDALLVALIIRQSPGRSFLSGFLGVFVLWAGLAWWIDMKNNGILSHRIAIIIKMGGSSVAVILATGIIGGLVAGMGALTGSYFHPAKRFY